MSSDSAGRRRFLAALAATFAPPLPGASFSLEDVKRYGAGSAVVRERVAAAAFLEAAARGAVPGIKGIVGFPRAHELLERIGRPLVEQAERRDVEWAFVLVEAAGPHPNACTPGAGVIAVYDTLLRFCPSVGELAAVIAHEIGHVVHRHAMRRMADDAMREALGLRYSQEQIAEAVARRPLAFDRVLQDVLAVMDRSYKRQWEHEADATIAELFRRTGYDLADAIRFFERLDTLETGRPDDLRCLYSTHPVTRERIRRLAGFSMPEPPTPDRNCEAFEALRRLVG